MKKVTEICTSELTSQAEEVVSLAFAFSEARIRASKGKEGPEIKALSAAVLSMQNAIAAFIAIAELNK